jgi:hypothetical protein
LTLHTSILTVSNGLDASGRTEEHYRLRFTELNAKRQLLKTNKDSISTVAAVASIPATSSSDHGVAGAADCVDGIGKENDKPIVPSKAIDVSMKAFDEMFSIDDGSSTNTSGFNIFKDSIKDTITAHYKSVHDLLANGAAIPSCDSSDSDSEDGVAVVGLSTIRRAGAGGELFEKKEHTRMLEKAKVKFPLYVCLSLLDKLVF